VFSLFKRSLVGSFHQIPRSTSVATWTNSSFRYNNRKNKFHVPRHAVELMDAKALPYEKLTA